MATCKLRSYNARRAAIFGTKLSKVDRLILLRSDMYTHSEFEFSARYNNVSFSATMADGSKCARFKPIDYSHIRERWDAVRLNYTDEQEDNAFNLAGSLAGTPYDVKGQICHATHFNLWKPSVNKTWCSKIVNRLMEYADMEYALVMNGILNSREIRPDQLDMMARYCYEMEGTEVVV